ncbi:MAG: TonB-dependent receptor plug domain-containing protein [bacterium]|nr:TonB-dependent receptor plug domain-containing protein [bacterium]
MRTITAFILALSLLGLEASAQTLRGRIGGFVTDEAGSVIPGARVRLVDQDTNRERRSASDPDGQFLVVQLEPGRYMMEVERDGYRRHEQELVLLTNQELRVEVPLVEGRVRERVVVRAARSVLKTDSARMGGVIENHLVRGLPLDGRNFLELSLLLPGVTPAAQGSAASVRGDVAFNVNGAREDSNNYLLDGVYNGDPKLNAFAVNAGVDAIQEFEVATSSYDASFGRNAGGQVNVVLKSGGNAWHGTTY